MRTASSVPFREMSAPVAVSCPYGANGPGVPVNRKRIDPTLRRVRTAPASGPAGAAYTVEGWVIVFVTRYGTPAGETANDSESTGPPG